MAGNENPKFTLTEEHIKLAGRLNFKVCPDTEYDDPFIPAIDRKRPFGNSGAVDDVLDILGRKRDEEGHCSEADVSHAEDLLIELPLALEIITQNRTFEPGTYEAERYGAYTQYRMMKNYKALKGALSEIGETCKTDEGRKRLEHIKYFCMCATGDDPWRVIKDIRCWTDIDPEYDRFRKVLIKHKKLAQGRKPAKAEAEAAAAEQN